MKYKMIACDLDGTLLNSKSEIDKETLDSIHKMVDMGYVFAVSSGRSIKLAKMVIGSIDRDIPLVLYNGGMITTLKSDKMIRNITMRDEDTKKIGDLMNSENGNFIYWKDEKLYANKDIVYTRKYARALELIIPKEPQYTHVSKMMMLGQNEELVSFRRKYLESMDSINCFFSSPFMLEICDKEVRKDKGIEALIQYYGIKREEVICCGDAENDLDMIKYAGLGVAMGNATEEVKKAADIITSTNDDHGIKKIIDKYILGEDND